MFGVLCVCVCVCVGVRLCVGVGVILFIFDVLGIICVCWGRVVCCGRGYFVYFWFALTCLGIDVKGCNISRKMILHVTRNTIGEVFLVLRV